MVRALACFGILVSLALIGWSGARADQCDAKGLTAYACEQAASSGNNLAPLRLAQSCPVPDGQVYCVYYEEGPGSSIRGIRLKVSKAGVVVARD